MSGCASALGNEAHVAIMEAQRLARDVTQMLLDAHETNEGGEVARVKVDFKDIASRYEMVLAGYNRSAERVNDLNAAINRLNESLR